MTFLQWSKVLGNIGEFVGAIAVVVTLLYLATQVRLSKEATEANTRQLDAVRKYNLVETYTRRSERVEGGYRDLALSDELSRISFSATKDPESLQEIDWYRMREWMHAHMHRLDAQHYQYQNGLLEEEAYDNLRKALARWAPIWQQFDVVPPRKSFQDEIASVLAADSADS